MLSLVFFVLTPAGFTVDAELWTDCTASVLHVEHANAAASSVKAECATVHQWWQPPPGDTPQSGDGLSGLSLSAPGVSTSRDSCRVSSVSVEAGAIVFTVWCDASMTTSHARARPGRR